MRRSATMNRSSVRTTGFCHTAAAVFVTLALGAGSLVAAQDANRAGKVVPLTTKDLSGIAGKEATMLTVEYPPGGSSPPHRHDSHVFVYVLEGSVVMQVDGREPVTLKPGETFYESPQDVHRTSANASATAAAKFLVFIVKDKGKAVTQPVGSAPKP
jgi:quercetin dioxygenase-like cupin family protein